MYESGDADGATAPGTIVLPIDRSFTVYAYSAEEADQLVRRDVQNGKLPKGRVYQICPQLGNPELIRSTVATLEGEFHRVFLDPASGLYAEFRRLRYVQPAPAEAAPAVMEEPASIKA